MVLGALPVKHMASGEIIRKVEGEALDIVGEGRSLIDYDLCACRDWGKVCERSVDKKGFLFCPEKKSECVARGKERR